jgi:lipocalin
MATPLPDIKIKVSTAKQDTKITSTTGSTISTKNSFKAVTNYEYEVDQNENKRLILILKPEYLSVFISDMKNIMKYDESSQYVNETTKRGYNPKITGV